MTQEKRTLYVRVGFYTIGCVVKHTQVDGE